MSVLFLRPRPASNEGRLLLPALETSVPASSSRLLMHLPVALPLNWGKLFVGLYLLLEAGSSGWKLTCCLAPPPENYCQLTSSSCKRLLLTIFLMRAADEHQLSCPFNWRPPTVGLYYLLAAAGDHFLVGGCQRLPIAFPCQLKTSAGLLLLEAAGDHLFIAEDCFLLYGVVEVFLLQLLD